MGTFGSTVVLFGGLGERDASYGLLADTWVWDGTAWAESTASGPPARAVGVMGMLP